MTVVTMDVSAELGDGLEESGEKPWEAGTVTNWSLAIYVQPTFDTIAAATATLDQPIGTDQGPPTVTCLPQFFPLSAPWGAALLPLVTSDKTQIHDHHRPLDHRRHRLRHHHRQR